MKIDLMINSVVLSVPYETYPNLQNKFIPQKKLYLWMSGHYAKSKSKQQIND